MLRQREAQPLQPTQPRAFPSASSSSRQHVRPRSAPSKPPMAPPPATAKSAPLSPVEAEGRPSPPLPAPPAKEKEKEKPKAGKLTEQWPIPPETVLRPKDSSAPQRGVDELHRGRLLGEGGFARVYEATESSGIVKALKVVSKQQLVTSKARTKLYAEIKIHQAMQHPNIIAFQQSFEDAENVYMQLELCSNGSLLDVLRKRRRFSEPETRFYLTQLIGACEYMHSNSVIHRDLKLGNLMLDSEMNLRVGDFGLAALVKFPGERKKTICGTPNYIAPEILFDQTNGHSFEVDIWSLGVIMYTLLVGKPPFQTKEVKNIYRKIKDNNYAFPDDVAFSEEATQLVSSILTTSPVERPSLSEVISHSFLTTGPFPRAIPSSAMSQVPDFQSMSRREAARNFREVMRDVGINFEGREQASLSKKAGLEEVVEEPEEVIVQSRTELVAKQVITATRVVEEKEAKVGIEQEVRRALQPDSPIADLLRSARKPLMVSPNHANEQIRPRKRVSSSLAKGAMAAAREASGQRPVPSSESQPLPIRSEPPTTGPSSVGPVSTVIQSARTAGHVPSPALLPARELYEATWRTLNTALAITSTAELTSVLVASAEPATAPSVFITSWVDYTHKYGTAYSLTDGTAGLYFNDSTTMVLSPGKNHFDYISNRKNHIYSRQHHTVSSHPAELDRKVYLLRYFEEYMAKTLLRDVRCIFSDIERTKNLDFLVKYYRMKSAIVFKLSNDVLQFNFYDHTKILLSSLSLVDHALTVTFIDPDFRLQTFSLYALFSEASRLGFYRTRSFVDSDPKRQKRLEQLSAIVEKLDYCRGVLKSLSARKSGLALASGEAK